MLTSAKEKAQLSVEIMEKFAPHMDDSTQLFQKMGEMITNFGVLIESFPEIHGEKKIAFLNFINSFKVYIEGATSNYNDLRAFYSFMTLTTNTLIAEFKEAIGVE